MSKSQRPDPYPIDEVLGLKQLSQEIADDEFDRFIDELGEAGPNRYRLLAILQRLRRDEPAVEQEE